jgi:hypothetical protein
MMFQFHAHLRSACRRALETNEIYWKVEREFRELQNRRRRCCRNCSYFDDNPYLPCAIAPIQAAMLEADNDCQFFELKER